MAPSASALRIAISSEADLRCSFSYLRAGAVLQHAQRLCVNLTAKLGGEPRLGCMYFSRNTGNFSIPILNHYLKSYTAGIYLAAHVNGGYKPSNKNICKVDTMCLTETYRSGIMPGSSKEQVLSRLPADCTSIMLHYEKIGKLGRSYGHATCLRQAQGTWWHVDSETVALQRSKAAPTGLSCTATYISSNMAFPP